MADYKKSSVHCHSTMCDGKNTLQEMASAACAKGLTTLGFTGHSYTQRDREYCMSPSRTAQYKATIAKLKTEYKGKVDILCGIEWDLLSEDKRTGYDYWIGSAHHLYGKNTGKYYEIDFRPQDLHDCIYDDFYGQKGDAYDPVPREKIILQPERRFDERPHLQEPVHLYAAHPGVVPLPAAL